MDDRTGSTSSAAAVPPAGAPTELRPSGHADDLRPHAEDAARWTGSTAVLTAGGRTRLVLAGEVDASMDEELTTCTTEITRLGQPLDVDVRNVTFMDSSVLAVIARLTQRLSGPVRVIGPSDSVRFLLELTHLVDVIEILDEDPEA